MGILRRLVKDRISTFANILRRFCYNTDCAYSIAEIGVKISDFYNVSYIVYARRSTKHSWYWFAKIDFLDEDEKTGATHGADYLAKIDGIKVKFVF
jgi:hypothetical protein